MNKTIASLALTMSASSAFALIGPGPGKPQPKPNHYCLSTYENTDGSLSLGTCDQTAMNERRQLKLNENGCADNQAEFQSRTIKIKACPTYVQL